MYDLEGNLKIFQPISVMQMLNIGNATGELKLIVKGNEASVFFEKGRVTYASIANRPFKLGELLVQRQLITRRKLAQMLKKKPKQVRIGDILIEEGVIGEAELHSAVEEQITHVIFEVVRWDNGVFAFTNGKTPDEQDVFIDIPLDHLILEGLKRLDEERKPG